MSSDSEDDAPLLRRANTKGTARGPSVKQEPGAATKPGVIKAEVKEEDVPGVKGVQGKEQRTEAKAKGQDKKTPSAKGKVTVKEEDAAQNGKAPKKVKEESKQTREKKEYDMPGQSREPPPETDSLRKFYTSLLEQRPDSEMAKKWCLTHGLLSREVAEELVAQLKKSKPAIKSPVKTSARSESKVATKPRRPAEKAPTAKRQRQAVSPPKTTRAKYSDEEEESGSSSEGWDDDEPIAKSKPAAKLAAAKPASAAKGAKKGGTSVTNLGSSDDDDDLPLVQRTKK